MQTAWAVLALLAAGLHGHDSVRRGVDYLLQCQQADGSWQQSLHLATSVSEHTVIRASADETVYPLAAIGSFQKLLK